MGEYLGQVTNLITCEELIELTNFTGGQSSSTGDITWGKILENGKIYLISQQLPKRNITWTNLNSQELIFGKTITIGEDKYICRSMTGLNDDNSYGGEWAKWVVDLLIPQGMNFSNMAGRYRFTQDLIDEKALLVGHYNGSPTYTTITIDSSSTNYSWSPILELMPRCGFNISNHDKGEITESFNLNYNVTGDTFTLVEKLDKTPIRTLENQTSGTEYTLDLSAQWDNISYGKHTIEIIATDSNNLSSIVTITFNKIKEITKPIATESSLKELVEHIGNIDKDIDYLKFKLSDNLKEKGVECSDTDKMSSLVDKVEKANTVVMASDNILIENIDANYTYYGTTNYLYSRFTSLFNGSIRVHFKGKCATNGASGKCTFVHTRNGVAVDSSSEIAVPYSIADIFYDFNNVLVGDTIEIYIKAYATGSSYAVIGMNSSLRGDIV